MFLFGDGAIEMNGIHKQKNDDCQKRKHSNEIENILVLIDEKCSSVSTQRFEIFKAK